MSLSIRMEWKLANWTGTLKSIAEKFCLPKHLFADVTSVHNRI